MRLRPRAAVATLLMLTTIGYALGCQAVPSADDLKALDGEWIYVEDRTAGRPLEQQTPPMNSRFTFRVESGAIILAYGHGGIGRDVRVSLDGSTTEVKNPTTGGASYCKAVWKDGALTYEITFVRREGGSPEGLIKREFRVTPEGMIVRSNLGSPTELTSVGLYRHPQDIALPTPFKASISDLKWLEGAWVGTRSSGSTFEERWSPAKGGAMLAVSRTVNAGGRMSAFEFLRIVERNGGLVYIAQPGGAPPTEFILSELSGNRAVFDNPRHDYPKRIVYELSADGGLTATIGFMKGGTPGRFEFKRESG